MLGSPDLAFIERAIVVVKGWHTETFSSAVLTHAPEIFRFVEPRVFQQAARAFGKDGTPLKILVVPALPQAAEARDESIALLRSKGIDAVIPFRTMLADLVNQTRGQPQLPEVRPAPDHSHPEELRFLQGAAVGAVQDQTQEAQAAGKTSEGRRPDRPRAADNFPISQIRLPWR